MRVLLTGAAGFIGSAVARALTEHGHEFVRLDALLPQAHGSDRETDRALVRGDLRDGDLLRRVLRGVEVVCHQAAMVGHGVDPRDMPDYRPTTTTPPPSCSPPCTKRASRGWCWPPRW